MKNGDNGSVLAPETRPLSHFAKTIRSKNAAPFRLTLDVIFAGKDSFDHVLSTGLLNPQTVAAAYNVDVKTMSSWHVFHEGYAFKFTFLRPIVQGALGESDIYGAQQHVPLMNIQIPVSTGIHPRATDSGDRDA